MSSVFDLEHIFVVFAPGASGNFIVGLLNNLQSKKLDKLDVASTGSTHSNNIVNRKISGRDYISLGTFVSERRKFYSEVERLQYYKSMIQSNVTGTSITWTHDYNNISDYTNLFPNSKILVITAETEEEQLAITFMHCIKNLTDHDMSTPFSEEEWHQVTNYWNKLIRMDLSTILPKEKIDEAINDKDVMTYFTIDRTLKFYHLGEYQHLPVFAHNGHLSPTPYNLSEFINEQCTLLPYKYLMDHNSAMLLDRIQNLIPLSDNEQNYVVQLFDDYKSKQQNEILDSPHEYLKQLKNKAMTKIKELT
jgi:hypothetical protein